MKKRPKYYGALFFSVPKEVHALRFILSVSHTCTPSALIVRTHTRKLAEIHLALPKDGIVLQKVRRYILLCRMPPSNPLVFGLRVFHP